jgi:hypothetical protein
MERPSRSVKEKSLRSDSLEAALLLAEDEALIAKAEELLRAEEYNECRKRP